MDPAVSTDRPALDEPAGLAARIRTVRAARGLTQSGLARRAGIGKATLSGLEAGTRNPTLETLQALSAALDLPLTALLGAQTAPGPTGGRPAIHGAAVEIDLLRVFDDGPVTYELYRLRVPAGTAQRSAAHHRGVTEHVTVFAGVLWAGPVDAPRRAGPGEHLEWAADETHTYTAEPGVDVHASLLIRYPRPD